MQSRPDLPSDVVLVAAHEICQLKRLFELLEEHDFSENDKWFTQIKSIYAQTFSPVMRKFSRTI